MSDECPSCQYWRAKGAKFCRDCGRALPHNNPQKNEPVLSILVLLSVIPVAAIILTNEIYSIVNFNRICDANSALSYYCSISFGLENVTLLEVSGIGSTIMFASLIVIEGACLAYAVYRCVLALKIKRQGDELPAEKTGLCAASSGLAASLSFAIVYMLIAAIIGELPSTEWMSSYSDDQMTFMLTRAGVREELMFRVFWIGLPMLILSAIVLKDRKCWHYLFGGFGMSKVAFAFIILSSVLFGLAHDDGWGWSKVLESAIAGVIFGYLYVEYGLYAAIIAHTANDVMSVFGYMGLAGLETLLLMLLIVLGIVTIIRWILRPNWNAVDPRKMETLPEKLEGNVLDHWGRH